MEHHNHHAAQEKKSVNFLAPIIGGILIWAIMLITEHALDCKKAAAEHHNDVTTEQTEQPAHH